MRQCWVVCVFIVTNYMLACSHVVCTEHFPSLHFPVTLISLVLLQY